MNKNKYFEQEMQINDVLTYQSKELKKISMPSVSECNQNISDTENLLKNLGYEQQLNKIVSTKTMSKPKKEMIIPSWESLCKEAEASVGTGNTLEALFTAEELQNNKTAVRILNDEYNAIHKLDKCDIIISAVAGVLSGAVDCALGGFVTDSSGRNVPGTMSEFVRKAFDKILTPDRIKKLEDLSKVSYDALNYDNKGNVIVNEIVDGLSPMFHHEVSLGHDPILGFVFGVLDMLRGTVTTIGFDGKFIIQAAEGFSERKSQNVFEAIATVFLHMLSDVNGSSSAKNGGMGLPVPFMALFNKLQFGKVGENETISELVKSMFYQGYDFRHFCSMSISVMITEVIVRVSYFAKRLHEGYSFKEAIPIGCNHEKKPKLATMLFIAHTSSTAINAGKIAFTKNPLNINYAQWIAFAKYSYKQLKWILIEKPEARDAYVSGKINDELTLIYSDLDKLMDEYSDEYIISFE